MSYYLPNNNPEEFLELNARKINIKNPKYVDLLFELAEDEELIGWYQRIDSTGGFANVVWLESAKTFINFRDQIGKHVELKGFYAMPREIFIKYIY